MNKDLVNGGLTNMDQNNKTILPSVVTVARKVDSKKEESKKAVKPEKLNSIELKSPKNENNKAQGMNLIAAGGEGTAHGYNADVRPIDKELLKIKDATEIFKNAKELQRVMNEVLDGIQNDMPGSPQYKALDPNQAQGIIGGVLQKPGAAPVYTPPDVSRQQIATSIATMVSSAVASLSSDKESLSSALPASKAVESGAKVINEIQAQYRNNYVAVLKAYGESVKNYSTNAANMWKELEKAVGDRNKFVLDAYKQQSTNWHNFSEERKEALFKKIDVQSKGQKLSTDLATAKSKEINKGRKSWADASAVNARIHSSALLKLGSEYLKMYGDNKTQETEIIRLSIQTAKTTGRTMGEVLPIVNNLVKNKPIMDANPKIALNAIAYQKRLQELVKDHTFWHFWEPNDLWKGERTELLQYMANGLYIPEQHLNKDFVESFLDTVHYYSGNENEAPGLATSNELILKNARKLYTEVKTYKDVEAMKRQAVRYGQRVAYDEKKREIAAGKIAAGLYTMTSSPVYKEAMDYYNTYHKYRTKAEGHFIKAIQAAESVNAAVTDSLIARQAAGNILLNSSK